MSEESCTAYKGSLVLSARLFAKLKSWLRGQELSDKRIESEKAGRAPSDPNLPKLVQFNPVDEFYRDLLNKDLKTFTAFSLQSRSLIVRDVFAKSATLGRVGYRSLVNEVDYLTRTSKQQDATAFETTVYQPEVLLSLASLLMNSARNDFDTHSGAQIYKLVIMKYGQDVLSDHHKLQYIEGLAELRRYEEQAKLIESFNIAELAPLQAELMNLDRIAYECSGREWLAALNELYEHLGMLKVGLAGDKNLPLMDRLESTNDVHIEGPKITVLMPTYAPTDGIHTALRSLMHQTWDNLEIIVIDDGSPGKYDEILSGLEYLDSRIRLIRLPHNSGAYVARNAGLAMASGEFITVHDDDDWSHPEKLASQAEVLVADDLIVATTSAHIRSTEDMQFRRINTKPKHLQTNYSSLMFRKEITDQIGGWDTSNRGSDAEFAIRVEQNYGAASVTHMTALPMSFSRVWDGSLTSGEMYRGYFAYSRLLYRWAFREWHRNSKTLAGGPVLRSGQPRPYPIPTTFEPGARNRDLGVFDVIYVSDFSKQAKFASTVLHEIKSSVRAGLRVGFMHIDSPQTHKRGGISSGLFELQNYGNLVQVAENNVAEANLMVVYDASIGMFLDEFRSTVIVHNGIVVYDRGPSLLGARERDAVNIRQTLEHLDSSFKSKFRIVGSSSKEHISIREMVPPERVLSNKYIWNPHVNTDQGKISAPANSPVIGFHSFGNKYRWPENQKKFNSVYNSSHYETRFYGIMNPLLANLGKEIVSEAGVVDYKRHSLDDFLKSIDFWIYFPHERLEEDRIWLPVLNAMQAGKVVILPRHLKSIYGKAALYVDAPDVSSIVIEFSQDAEKYSAQAKRGQELVKSGFDAPSYVGRLRQLFHDRDE